MNRHCSIPFLGETRNSSFLSLGAYSRPAAAPSCGGNTRRDGTPPSPSVVVASKPTCFTFTVPMFVQKFSLLTVSRPRPGIGILKIKMLPYELSTLCLVPTNYWMINEPGDGSLSPCRIPSLLRRAKKPASFNGIVGSAEQLKVVDSAPTDCSTN